MTITFTDIPSSIRKPGKYFEFNTALAVRTLPTNRQKLLIIAQRTTGGSVAELVPTEVFSDVEAAEYFGDGSQAHLMAKAAIDANPYVALSICAMDDAGAGVAATGTVTISDPAPATGTLTLWVGNQSVSIAVTIADAVGVIATALAAEITATPSLPVTAAADAAVVTLTAKNDGIQGNTIAVSYEAANSCCAAVIVDMASGATDPDATNALAACVATQYDIIALSLNDATSIGLMTTHLDLVSGPLEQRPGVGVYGYSGVLATGTTLAGNINHERAVCPFVRGTRSLDCEIAAAFGAILAYEEDPARPLNTLALTGIHAPAIASRLSRTEQETCLWAGVAPCEVGPGGDVQIVRAITTYTLNASSISDVSMLDITTIRTLDYVRKACRERIALRFPREKLNARVVSSVRSELLSVLYALEELEIVENVDDEKDALVVERSATDANRLNAKIPADVVNGLHVFAGRIDLIL